MAIIKSKKELNFYIMADRLMKGLPAKKTIKEMLMGGGIIQYQRYMRLYNYHKHKSSVFSKVQSLYYGRRFMSLGKKLGFSIGDEVFGYGLVIPHYGTIVVNNNVRAGNYCVLHTSTCIGGGNKVLGDGFYMGAGAKVMGEGIYGAGVTLGANCMANRGACDNVLLVGVPAVIKSTNYPVWYVRDGETFQKRVDQIESLRKKMKL